MGDLTTVARESVGARPGHVRADPGAVGASAKRGPHRSGPVNLDSDAINFVVDDQPPTCNTGVKSFGVDSDAVRVASNPVFFGGGAAASASAPELYHRGVDYLTLTCADEAEATRLALLAWALRRDFEARGNKERSFTFAGYQGYSIGPVQYGERHDGVILRTSSLAAETALVEVRRAKLEALTATRVDVQLTVDFGTERAKLGLGKLIADAASCAARQRSKSRPYRVALLDGYGDGDTVIIGSRQSEGYGRSYDKYRESIHKAEDRMLAAGQFGPGAWRYEVEHKGSQARQLFKLLVGVDSVDEFVQQHVRGWYQDHGVAIPVGEGAAPAIRSLRHKSDLERSLMWLRTSVAPTVKQLIEAGHRDEVLRALGLGGCGEQ